MSYRTATPVIDPYARSRERALRHAARGRTLRASSSATVGLCVALALWVIFAFSLGVLGHPSVGGMGPHGPGFSFDPRQVFLVSACSLPFGFVATYLVSRAVRGPIARLVARQARRGCEGVAPAEADELAHAAAALV